MIWATQVHASGFNCAGYAAGQISDEDAAVRANRAIGFLESQTRSLHPPRITIQRSTVPIYFLRYQQVHLLQEILKRVLLTESASTLEIGYGSPSLLLALQVATRCQTAGVDPHPIPVEWGPFLRGTQLHSGEPLKDEAATRFVSRFGPYDLIYALDVYKADSEFRFGIPFSLPTDALSYLRWIALNLKPGAHFIVMNDYNKPMPFERAQIQAAGFKIEVWGETQELSLHPEMRRILSESYGPEAGKMALYVLRKH